MSDKLNESVPCYGGAFDIDPHSFWSREDLDEFASELNDRLGDEFGVKEIYIDYFNVLEVVAGNEEYEATVFYKIDLRTIKKPLDLIEKHLEPVFQKLTEKLNGYLHT